MLFMHLLKQERQLIMYNVVIVGFGGMGRGHFVQLDKLDNLNVVGILDIK